MVGLYRDEHAQTAAEYNTVIGNMDNANSMAFYKARVLEDMESGYTILPDLTDPLYTDLFRNLNLPFDTAKDAVLVG